MTKFSKLSLIAALAVAGTTASAQPLAEAIKNVDVSGSVTYRYNDYEQNAAGNGTATTTDDNRATNNYKIALDIKSKITDDVMFNSRLIMGDNDSTGEASIGTSTSADSNLNVQLSEANFAYTGIANTAVVIGKMGLNTAFTVARDELGAENTGTGLLAQTSLESATLFAGYFNQTNSNVANDTGLTLTGAENVIVTGISLAVGPVAVDASYIDMADIFDAYTIGASGEFELDAATIEAFIRYSALDIEDSISTADNSLFKVGVAANVGMFGAHLSYGKTDKEGGVVGLLSGTETGFDEHWRVTLDGNADSSVIYAGVDAQVTEKVNLALNYSNMSDDANANSDESEVFGQVTYDHAENLSTFVRFGQYENEERADKSETAGRVQIQYTF